MTKKFFGPVVIVCATLFAVSTVFAVTINTNIPGVTNLNPATGPCTLVFGFYNFALLIGGILAFAAITYGGIRYTLAAGNPSGQSDAKEWVKGAIFGLLLLVGAYLILNVINPDITKCTLPPLTQVAAPSGGGTTGTGNNYGCQAANGVIACSPGNLSNCSDVPSCATGAGSLTPCGLWSTSRCGQSLPTGGGGGTTGGGGYLNGAGCSFDWQCQSNYCSAGVCQGGSGGGILGTPGAICTANSDCQSFVCNFSATPPTCQ